MLTKAHWFRLFVCCVCLSLWASAPATAQYTSSNVDLLSHVPLSTLGGTFAEDCWGYVSPSQREYALIGTSDGTAFVEITNPAAPVVVAFLFQDSQGRDIKVYQNYVYSTADVGPTEIFDVSNIDAGVVTYAGTIPQGSHNLAIDEVSGFLYLAIGRQLDIYDLSNPVNPAFVGRYFAESHDVQVVTFTTGSFAGRQIAFNFAGTEGRLVILDVTNKANIVLIGQATYPNSAYTHQGWLSEDQQYVYLNDELDNIPQTTIIDVSNLAAPVYLGEFSNNIPSTDHNLYLNDGYIFEANYSSGLRVFDATDRLNPVEVGFFDTHPADDAPSNDGAWSCYPFFPSGTLIVSDTEDGLFVLDVCRATTPATATSRNAGTNPASYSISTPVLGSSFSATVDLAGTTGHSFAGLFGYAAPLSLGLTGGQVLLMDITDPSGEFLAQPLTPGPLAVFSAPIPNDTVLCGLSLSTQAVHLGGVQPFALSNAIDLVLGR